LSALCRFSACFWCACWRGAYRRIPSSGHGVGVVRRCLSLRRTLWDLTAVGLILAK
jgi:hypothetical protein